MPLFKMLLSALPLMSAIDTPCPGQQGTDGGKMGGRPAMAKNIPDQP